MVTMAAYGNCGGPAQGPLPILVGDWADTCPTAAVEGDAEIQDLVDLVPSRFGPGLLADTPRMRMLPALREYWDAACGWLAEYRDAQEAEELDRLDAKGVDTRVARAVREARHA